MTNWIPVLDRSRPLYLAIADAIAQDVDGGTLPDGARLPPQRALAWKLGVTLGTVTRAYREAEDRGLLAGEVGRGSYIRRSRQATPLAAQSGEPEGSVDLSHAIPPPVVTTEEFDAAMQSVLRDPRRLGLLDYSPTDGFPQHKAMAVSWLTRSGISVTEQDVVISAGAHLGLITVLEAISAPGDKVMAEQVNYALLGNTFRNAHLESVPLTMDADGLLPDALEKAVRTSKARILYLVPSLQNPTTNTMSRRRRDAIVSIARKHDLTLVEDDIFRLLDSRTQPPTFYALAPERTFHITSLSKTLAPGLRIGIVATPQGQDRILRSHMRNAASRTVGISGEIARYWIETDMASTILTRTRNELAARRETFQDIFKGTKFRCEPGAPYAWLELPERWPATRFANTLAAKRIKLSPGSIFQLSSNLRSHHVRICFGSPGTVLQTRKAFETIRSVMNDEPEDDFTPVA